MDTIFTTLLALTLLGGNPPLTAINATALPVHESPLQVSEPDDLDLYIEELAFAESSGKEDVQIIDTNGKWSRGVLQFQDDTFIRYSNKYGVLGHILDPVLQKKLARLILLEKNGWKNWYTSVGKIGLPPSL